MQGDGGLQGHWLGAASGLAVAFTSFLSLSPYTHTSYVYYTRIMYKYISTLVGKNTNPSEEEMSEVITSCLCGKKLD